MAVFSFNDIENAFLFVGSAPYGENEAYLDTELRTSRTNMTESVISSGGGAPMHGSRTCWTQRGFWRHGIVLKTTGKKKRSAIGAGRIR